MTCCQYNVPLKLGDYFMGNSVVVAAVVVDDSFALRFFLVFTEKG